MTHPSTLNPILNLFRIRSEHQNKPRLAHTFTMLIEDGVMPALTPTATAQDQSEAHLILTRYIYAAA